jgi:hypothetical protein
VSEIESHTGVSHSRKRNGYKIVFASVSRIGRIERAARREFILSADQRILSRSVLERAYPRLSRFADWHYLAARRALRQEAIVVACNRFGRGRHNLWVPKKAEACEAVANALPRNSKVTLGDVR